MSQRGGGEGQTEVIWRCGMSAGEVLMMMEM